MLARKIRILFDANALDVFFALFFASGGISTTAKYRKYEIPYTVFVTGVTVVQLLGCAVGYANTAVTANRVEILLQASSHVYLGSLHWCLKMNRVRLQRFVHHARHHHRYLPPSVSREVAALTRTFFVRRLKMGLSAFCAFLFVVCSISLVTPLFVDFDYDDRYAYVMPFWFTCSAPHDNRFPVPAAGCWYIDTVPKYALMNGVEITLFNIELFSYVTSFAFFAFTQAHFKAHLRLILARIERLDETVVVDGRRMSYAKRSTVRADCRRRGWRSGRRTVGQRDVLCSEFVDVIKHHQYLRQVVNSILNFLQWIVSASLAGFISVVVFSTFLFVTENGSGKGELLFKIKMGCIVANAGTMFFLYCHGAEVTTHVNETISDAIYSMSWYTKSLQFRKIAVPFMMQLRNGMGISAFFVYKLNLSFFMRVIRMVFSALNVLLMTIK